MEQRLIDGKDNTNGLKAKYNVYKTFDGTMVNNCFVLRPDKDPAAVIALQAYAQATENLALSRDILEWVGSPQTVDPVHAAGVCYCRECKSANTRDDMGADFYECSQNGVTVFCNGGHFCSYGERRIEP